MRNRFSTPTVRGVGVRVTAHPVPLGTPTVYRYVTAAGADGSTTDASAIPSTALVMPSS